MHYSAMGLSLFIAGLGIYIAYLTYYRKKISADIAAGKYPGLYKFLLNKWYFDEIYGALVVGGTIAFTHLLRWFDNTIIDGMVNGSASWTKAVVFGYREHKKTTKFSALAFLIVGVFVSLLVALWTGQWFLSSQQTISSMLSAIIMAFLCGGLTFFFFWSGAGGFDKHVVDGLVNGVAYSSGFFGILFRKLQTGKVQTYIVFVVLGVMVFFFVFR